MTNIFATSDVVARNAASLLKAELVLGRLVFRDAEADFVGGVGDTVRVRIPRVLQASKFTGSTSAIATSLNEQTVPVKLNTHAMSPLELTAKDMTLNVDSFSAQVLVPQVAGVAEMVEAEIASVIQPVIDAATLTIDPANPRDAITQAGEILDTRKVGAKTRVLVVSPSVKRVLLMDPNLSQADAAGSDSALRDAAVGRLHGFDVYMSSDLTDGAVAMTKEAFAAAIKAPAKPESVSGASATDDDGQGYAMTWFIAFNGETRTELSIAEAFVGATVLDPQRAVGLKLTDAA